MTVRNKQRKRLQTRIGYMQRTFLFALVVLQASALAPVGVQTQTNLTGQERLVQLRAMLPPSPPWEKWLDQTKELPPDFDAMPSVPFLPDPLRFANGYEVKKDDWPRRRQELLKLFQYYVTGSFPPSPMNVRPADIKSRAEPGAFIDDVTLEFGTNHAAKLHLEVMIPKGPGPFPVFITQDTHRSWALVAVSRGYIGCVYAGADSRDDTAAWPPLWPNEDWTKLTRRAWAASRCIDYLYHLPMVLTNQIALAGHSRNGKTSLIAAAMDQRINAVIASSSGAGGACSWRFFSEAQFGEGIEMITRVFPDWFHPRLRFFTGRENKLPIDQPELIACIAPRPCLISSALNDSVESIWAIEQTFYSALRVYALLGKGGLLNLRYRPGGHETRAEDIESYLDWLDAVFGRAPYTLPDVAIFPTYDLWQKVSDVKLDPLTFPTNDLKNLLVGTNATKIMFPAQWLDKRREVRGRILWALGQAPPFVETGAGTYGAEKPPLAKLLGRDRVPPSLEKRSLNFGNYIAGDLYFPTNADQANRKLPAVIWLHPISVSNGYVPGYRRGELPHIALAQRGFAVFAFDQIGNGSRLEEVRHFYFRYPYWSLLGKMVEDTLAAEEALRKLPFIDRQRIYLLGYGTGGMTALHAAALDDRIAGVVSVAGFTPMRLDTLDKGTGGVARWSRWLPLEPCLAAFVGHEARIPYDYHEVLAMIAPRKVAVIAPRIDYQATLADVETCVDEAAKVFELLSAPDHLHFQVLDDYNHFSPETQKEAFSRLAAMAGW